MFEDLDQTDYGDRRALNHGGEYEAPGSLGSSAWLLNIEMIDSWRLAQGKLGGRSPHRGHHIPSITW